MAMNLILDHLLELSNHFGLGWPGVIGFLLLTALSFIILFREVASWLFKTQGLRGELRTIHQSLAAIEKKLDHLEERRESLQAQQRLKQELSQKAAERVNWQLSKTVAKETPPLTPNKPSHRFRLGREVKAPSENRQP